MARRVYLHIGTMKSATTYLQQLCEVNTEKLATAGMLWPKEDLRYQAIRDLFKRPPGGVDFTGAWRTVAKEIRRHDGDVLISNELLAAVTAAHVRRLVKLSKAEVHVVLTARDHARLMPSHWQTTIKNGRTHSWKQFSAAVCAEADDADAVRIHDWFWQRHDLVQILTRWQRYVPVEQMTLVTVPPPGADPEEVAGRFGAAIGLDLRGMPQPASRSNSSLGAHSAELMRRINEQAVEIGRMERSHGYRGALGGALASHADKEPGFALTQTQQDWVRRRALAANAELTALGVRVEGDLDDLIPAPAPPPGAVDPADATDVELLQAAQRGIMGMARTVTDLTLTRKDIAAQLRAGERARDRLRELTAQRQAEIAARPRARVARALRTAKGRVRRRT